MDGTATPGTSTHFAPGDHVHPTDTSRASVTYVDTQDALKAATIYVDAQDALKVNKAGDTMTGPLTTAGSGYVSTTSALNSIQVMSTYPDTNAAMTFHVQGMFGANFGLANDGNFYMGGWSHGGVAYKFHTTRDFNYTPLNKAGDTMTGTLTASSASLALVRSSGIPGNDMNASFYNTPPASKTFAADANGEANAPVSGWWFSESYRHSNGTNYWGTQVAWGWEDHANEMWQRNVSAGSFGAWVKYLNSANYSSYALPLSGGTVTGALTVNGELAAAAGYVRLGAPGSAGYIQYSGGGSYWLGSGGTIWHSGNVTPIINGRLAFLGDRTDIGFVEPWGGGVITGASGVTGDGTGFNFYITHRFRQMQLQNSAGTWFAIGYA